MINSKNKEKKSYIGAIQNCKLPQQKNNKNKQ